MLISGTPFPNHLLPLEGLSFLLVAIGVSGFGCSLAKAWRAKEKICSGVVE
jgi:hypothetical protein